MKKKLLLSSFLLMTIISLSACGKDGNNTNSITTTTTPTIEVTTTTTPDVETTPVVTPEIEVSSNDLGLVDMSTQDFQKALEDKETFYLFVKAETSLDDETKETIETNIKKLTSDYEILVPFYYIEETTDEIQNEISPILNNKNGSNYGMYAFKDGELIATFDNFVVDEENSISIKNRTINFIFENELFVNNHGIELITYEEVQEKRQNGEEFILYVGRDTCSYCNVFMPSLVTVNEQLEQETTERTYKLYYLYTQSYKTAINNKVDGAQETWDALKEDLGIEGTPSVIYFKDGENVYMFKDYVDKEIKNNGTAEELEKAQEETAKHLMNWFNSLDTVQ